LSSTRCRALLDWYHSHARRLPWRETNDPYRIWISEIMLQQTQVTTVLPRYAAWFDRFPDIATLARADEDEVLKTWEGLGYYRRARMLHAAATQICAAHSGNFPPAFDDIAALPGIGRSTAGAIASFCFGAATPVLDGNVKRILKRWHHAPGATDRQLWSWAQQSIDDSGNPATWNQATMELGATICTPRNPACDACPAAAHCASAGRVSDTTPAKRTRVRDLHWRIDLYTDPEQGVWLAQRPASGIWAKLWTPPITELGVAPDTEPTHVHMLTHRRLHLYAAVAEQTPVGEGKWFPNLEAAALPTGIRQMLAKHGTPC